MKISYRIVIITVISSTRIYQDVNVMLLKFRVYMKYREKADPYRILKVSI